jgi:hypothetical protein
VAICCRGSAWGGSLFAHSLIPDTWMGLVLRADGSRRFVPAGEDPAPANDDRLLLVRNRPLTLPIELAACPSADHPVDADVELLVRWPAHEDDLAALHAGLMNSEELTLERLGDALRRAGLEPALRGFLQTQPAETLVHGDVRPALLEHLRTALQRFLFTTGLTLERLGTVSFRSPDLDRAARVDREAAHRVKQIEARGMVERTALAATRRRLDHLGDVLTKLKAAADEQGNLRWRELLPTLTPGERGRLLENLWRLAPDRTAARALVLVAGHRCAWLDPSEPNRITQQVTLPDDLGGLRSVTYAPDDGALLVGAARGIWRLDATTGEVRGHYVVPGHEQPRTGFNAAVISRGHLFATHSQLGAWSWSLDDPTDVEPLLKPIEGIPRTIRAATVDQRGRVLLAADNRVHAFDLAGETAWQTGPVDGSIHALAALESWLFVGTSTGALLRCDLHLRDAWLPVHRARGAIESIDARRWDDLIELVIPAGPDGVCAVYVGERFIAHLLRPDVAVRRTWACDDTLVAMADGRDRLTVLGGAMPAGAGQDVNVARLLGSSMQDACLVTEEGT